MDDPTPSPCFEFDPSFAQERLWFLHQLIPGNPFYNICRCWRIQGAVNPGWLEAALKKLVHRQEMLRASMIERDGKPRLRVVEHVSVKLPVLQALEEDVQRLKEEERQAPIPLGGAQLWRARLLQLSADEWGLLFTIHHLVADGWSMEVFTRELSELYQAESRGEPPALISLEIQYPDFAAWQREELVGETYESHVRFWRRTLEGYEQFEFPRTKPRPPQLSFEGGLEPIRIAADDWTRLKLLAAREDATPFMAMLGVFLTMVHRYTGQEDMIVGSPIANRQLRETESLIGFFVNSLVLRTSLEGKPTFRELLRRIRNSCLDAYAHLDLPFERLVEEIQPDRDLSRNPIFQVMVALHNSEAESWKVPGWKVKHEQSGRVTTRVDWETHLWEKDSGVEGFFIFASDLFDPALAAQMSRHFSLLAASMAQNPDLSLATAPFLTAAENELLLSDAPLGSPSNFQRWDEMVAETARKFPDRTAIEWESERITYAALTTQANGVAHRLRNQGLGVDQIAALEMERCPELIIGLLGILRAGATYVPLDPLLPASRLHWMRQDSGATLTVDRDFVQQAVAMASAPALENQKNSVAYILYTSGSTGQPKGVAVTHAGLLNLAEAQQAVFAATERDRVLQFATISFDASIFEITMAWRAGAALIMASREDLMPGYPLGNFLLERKISNVTLPPGALQLVPQQPLPELQVIIVAGEPCPAELPGQWAPGRRFFNAYGPTEATVWATVKECQPSDLPPTIGRAIPNMGTVVVDTHGNLSPIFGSGELLLAGPGLARGYWNQETLTRNRFVPNPYEALPGPRLYRTGDNVRRLPGGELQFLGRMDQQVKVRGFRIELGEIESALLTMPGVHLAAADARGERIFAWVQPSENAAQQFAQAQLAEWRELYEAAYPQTESDEPDFSGWMDSFTGTPIPENEMMEWLEDAECQILRLQPTRVLEIGCGSGLIMSRIAPHVSHYIGTDFSTAAISAARRFADHQQWHHVRILKTEAEDLSSFTAGEFDLVILNSVVQYFPSASFLEQVLKRAATILTPDGKIFLGDIRSMALLPVFHAVRERLRTPSLSLSEWRERTRRAVFLERELCISPKWFARTAPSLGLVLQRVDAKEGRGKNELMKYRYQAVLGKSGVPLQNFETTGAGQERLEQEIGCHNEMDGESHASLPSWCLEPEINNPMAARLETEWPAALRKNLGTVLPDYMVPSEIFLASQFPFSPSGKLLRSQLPVTRNQRPPLDEPMSSLEKSVRETIAEFLCRNVCLDDDFFGLGGTSLLAVRIALDLEKQLQRSVPVKWMFQAPTPRRLAAIMAANASEALPLPDRSLPPAISLAQQRLWFVDKLITTKEAYNIPCRLVLRGDLDVPRLNRALNEILDRHPVLRTGIISISGRPVPQVQPAAALELSTAIGSLDEEALRPFELSTTPLIRACLEQRGESEYVLQVTFHHIVADGWSVGVFAKELAAFYDGMPLPPLTLSYADYARSQRAWLDSRECISMTSFWRHALRNVNPFDLPFVKPRPALATFVGSVVRTKWTKEIATRVRELASEEKSTPFMVLLSMFAQWMRRQIDRDQFVIGTPHANRTISGAENLIGFFVNMVALPLDVGSGISFRQLLSRVRECVIPALSHSAMPFDLLVDQLQLPRDLSRNPLFQILFALQSAEMNPPRFQALQADWSPTKIQRVRFDLEVHFYEQAEGLDLSLIYNTDLFESQDVETMAIDLLAIASKALSDPDALPSPAAPSRALGPPVRSQGLRIEERILAQSSNWLPAPAMIFGKKSISYGELIDRSACLAGALQARGVRPGDRVGIFLERGFDVGIALLAVLRTGAACVPLDPGYPDVRLRTICQEAALRFAVIGTNLPAWKFGEEIIWIQTDEVGIFAVPAELTGDAPLYVLYTSGSTGMPKGVEMPHQPICNLMDWQCARSGSNASRTLQFASLNFDVAFQEFFSTWLSGGAVVLVEEDRRLDPSRLLNHLERHQITRLFLPFVALKHLAETGTRKNRIPSCLREINTAGEQLHITPAMREFFGRLNKIHLRNQYGPTETHVVTEYELIGPPASWPSLPSLGTPIDGVEIMVADENGRTEPRGTMGEIWIGGHCLALGYADRPRLTDERFVWMDGHRWYRSGDLGRMLADGTLEFHGRSDDQVKVRGFRIELGEIENALTQGPTVADAAVAARPGRDGTLELCAWVTAKITGDASVPLAAKQYLESRLPNYMWPARIHLIESLPLSSNGKVNKQLLIDTPLQDAEMAGGDAQNLRELTVIRCFSEVLGRASIRRDDHFFRIGGHSLLALQLIAKLEAEWETEVPVRILFEHPTPLALAACDFAPHGEDGFLMVIRHGNGEPPLFLVPGGYGGENELLVFAGLLAGIPMDRTVIGVRSRVMDNPEGPSATLHHHAMKILMEMRQHQPSGNLTIAGECIAGVVAAEIALLANASGWDVDRLIILDTLVPSIGGYLKHRILRDSPLATVLKRFRNSSAPHPMDDLPIPVRRYYRLLLGWKPRALPFPLHLILSEEIRSRGDVIGSWSRLAVSDPVLHPVPGTHHSYIRDHAATAAIALGSATSYSQ